MHTLSSISSSFFSIPSAELMLIRICVNGLPCHAPPPFLPARSLIQRRLAGCPRSPPAPASSGLHPNQAEPVAVGMTYSRIQRGFWPNVRFETDTRTSASEASEPAILKWPLKARLEEPRHASADAGVRKRMVPKKGWFPLHLRRGMMPNFLVLLDFKTSRRCPRG